jgi:hypothetical protein
MAQDPLHGFEVAPGFEHERRRRVPHIVKPIFQVQPFAQPAKCVREDVWAEPPPEFAGAGRSTRSPPAGEPLPGKPEDVCEPHATSEKVRVMAGQRRAIAVPSMRVLISLEWTP